ncbi:MAG TPA: hypothetical protein VFB67_10975 [Candidatus Polarisedimenticolaceae bacterium]|nr:hypothetical protein [Candidatus Polarisedimenticolaceae bacterium]
MKKKIAWGVGMAMLATGLALADAKLPGLDGTSWKVEVNPDGMARDKGEKDFHETLTFADGKLVTNEGPKIGFSSAPYTMSRSGDHDWSFTAEQESDSQGKYVWSGTIHEDDIRGKLVWTKSDDSVLTYSFKGEKKK